MIIRSALLRQGRNTLHSSAARAASRRWQSTEATTASDSAAPLVQWLKGLDANGESSPSESAPTQRKQSSEQIAEDYLEHQRQKSLFRTMGGEKTPSYEPHQLVNNPPHPSDVTLELLLAAQSHMGHATARWHPANAQYIFGIRDGTHIISLDVTAAHLRRAAKVVSAVTAKGGLVLFVGTRDGQERAVIKAAELAGGYHLFDRWVPGSLTNSTQILGRCRLKVVDEFDNEVSGYESQTEDLPPMKPDLVVCLNPLENQTLLKECAMHNVPTIGVIDTNANPLQVTYPIPANDDSLRCIAVIAGVLGRAGEAGRTHRLEQAGRGKILAESNFPAKTYRGR